jgi:hypothetical protein
MTGSNSNANDCSEIFNDASISCQLIISNNIPENPNPNPEPEPEPDSTYMSSVPSECEDVMLQGFYWDSHDSQAKYGDTRWSTLCSQTSEISAYFDLVWLPPSSQSTGGLGYHPTHWNNQSGNLGNETQLKELITRLHNNGTQVIADIVINHRGNKSSWCDFPIDDFGEFGEFQLTSDHIVGNDEVNFDAGAGECKGAARGANDTGEQYGAARDLDHTNSYVRDAIKAYLRWLKSEFGYDGWRYDVAKGFSAKYFNEYNIASQIQFSTIQKLKFPWKLVSTFSRLQTLHTDQQKTRQSKRFSTNLSKKSKDIICIANDVLFFVDINEAGRTANSTLCCCYKSTLKSPFTSLTMKSAPFFSSSS